MSIRHFRWALLTASLSVAACGKSDKVDNGNDGKTPSKQGVSDLGTNPSTAAAASTGSGFQLPPGPLFRAQYDITVNALGMDVCNGKAELLVTNKFTFEIPQAKISCLANLCQFDLGATLAGVSQSSGGQGMLSGAKVENGIVKLPVVMGGRFTPERPVFLIPFSLKPEELAKIDINQQTTVQGAAGETASGNIRLNVLGINETYTANDGIAYNKVLRWQMTADSGFDAVKPKYLLFDSFKAAWNLDPIAIPEISVTGRLKQMMGMAGGAGAGGGGCSILSGAGGGGGGILSTITTLITATTSFTATLKLSGQTSLDPSKP